MSDVEILSFEDLRSIGQKTTDCGGDVTKARSQVAGSDGEHGLYSSYPAAQRLASHHDAVAKVFVETLAALREEMDEFGQAIVNAVKRYEDTEEGVQASLAHIVTQIEPRGPQAGSSTRQTFDDSRRSHGEELQANEADPSSDEPDNGAGF